MPTGLDALTVQVRSAADDIDAADWRAVTAGRGFYSSPRWLAFLEADSRYDVWYLVVRDADAVLAVLPVYLDAGVVHAGVDAFYDPATVFNSALRDPSRWRPALLAGGRAGYETELLLLPGLPPAARQQVLSALVARLAKLAAAWGVDATALMYLSSDTAVELTSVTGASPLLTTVSAGIPLDGCDTFDDYLNGLSAHRRRRIRSEIRDFSSGGFTVRHTRLSESVDRIAPLLAEHHGRYGHADTPDMLGAHFTQQAEHLDDLSHVLLCSDGATTVGALLIYEWDRVWYARAVGFADGVRGQSSAFFNLVYYLPIRAAIERGARGYEVGPSTIGAKVKRGAVLAPRWSLLIGPDDVADGWNDRELTRWSEELRTIGHPDVTPGWRAALGHRAAEGDLT
jgi:predicted N-acyltransferase